MLKTGSDGRLPSGSAHPDSAASYAPLQFQVLKTILAPEPKGSLVGAIDTDMYCGCAALCCQIKPRLQQHQSDALPLHAGQQIRMEMRRISIRHVAQGELRVMDRKGSARVSHPGGG